MQSQESAIAQKWCGEHRLVHEQWYAIHTRSNFEKSIAAELSAKRIENFLPTYEEIHHWHDRKRKVTVPLFPGYVFARFTDEPDVRLRVLKAAGVVRILGHGGAIESIPEEQIEAVQAIVNSRVHYYAQPFLREGARVRVVRGALCGLEGMLVRIKRQARLVISIPLLGQSVATEVNLRDVEPASDIKTSQVRTQALCIQI